MHIPGYDAWRLSGPHDDEPDMTDTTVESAVDIDLPDGYIECVGTYAATDGDLISVRIGGWDCPPHTLELIIGRESYLRCAALSPADLSEKLEQAARDAADDLADGGRHACGAIGSRSAGRL